MEETYIKTADGDVYKVREELASSYICYTQYKHYSLIIDKVKVVKKYTDISQLCDLFVDTTNLECVGDDWRFDGYDPEKKVLWWISPGEHTRFLSIDEFEDKTVIKGAVWTKSGLTYVCQINNEGNLELL